MNLFKTECLLNEKTVKALLKHNFPKPYKIVFLIPIIFFAVRFVVEAINEDYMLCAIQACFIVAAILIYLAVLNIEVKTKMKRLWESIHYNKTSFKDDSYTRADLATSGSITIYFDHFKKMVEAKEYFVLLTKANQLGLINKKTVEEAGKRAELICFLKSKCKSIKLPRQK